MNSEIVKNLRNLVGLDNDVPGLPIETIVEAAPVIGKILTSFKIHRLSKRLEIYAEKINELSLKVTSIDDEKFVDLLKDFLFPAILQQLLEEDEDNKIGYFLDGFGNVIDNRNVNESSLLILFDTLRELRFIEIEYLITLSSTYKNYCMKYREKNNKKVNNPFKNENFETIRPAIESKLERLGLINRSNSLSHQEMLKTLDREFGRVLRRSSDSSKVELTKFGNHFLNEFSLLKRFEI